MTEPRLADGLPAGEYHAAAALSAGGAIALIEECPAAYFHTSPFNPDRAAEENKKEFDIGTGAHLALLEPEKFDARTVIIDARDYKTKAAQEARDATYDEDKTPLLPKQLECVLALRAAVLAHPVAAKLFRGGTSETSFFWTDPATDVACKCRADRYHAAALVDLKTTGCAHPNALRRKGVDMGWGQRAAWYLDGVEIVTGARPEDYWFVVVETKPPHLVSVARLSDRWIDYGIQKNRKALDVFARCRARNDWPSYQPPLVGRYEPFTLEPPGWEDFHFEERREAGEFAVKPGKRQLAAAAEMFRP